MEDYSDPRHRIKVRIDVEDYSDPRHRLKVRIDLEDYSEPRHRLKVRIDVEDYSDPRHRIKVRIDLEDSSLLVFKQNAASCHNIYSLLFCMWSIIFSINIDKLFVYMFLINFFFCSMSTLVILLLPFGYIGVNYKTFWILFKSNCDRFFFCRFLMKFGQQFYQKDLTKLL